MTDNDRLSTAESLLIWVVVALATCVAAGFVAGLIDSFFM